MMRVPVRANCHRGRAGQQSYLVTALPMRGQPCRLGEEGRETKEQLAHDVARCGRDRRSQWFGRCGRHQRTVRPFRSNDGVRFLKSHKTGPRDSSHWTRTMSYDPRDNPL
jgi:hypothetical protein